MKRLVNRISWIVVMAAAVWTVQAAQETASDYQGQAAEEFLSKASVKESRPLGEGITRPFRVTLERDGVTHLAVFKNVDIRKPGVTTLADGSMEIDFQDSWETEIAAYVVDRIIGLGMVPATVQRYMDGKAGSMQWFVESEMTEAQRMERGLASPDAQDWQDQTDKAMLFDQLIANVDRHQRNILITKDYKIRLIDHSRSFRTNRSLKEPDKLQRFSQSLLEGIKRLEKDDLKKKVDSHISSGQIDRLLQRRDEILKLVDTRIAEKGEAAVLYK